MLQALLYRSLEKILKLLRFNLYKVFLSVGLTDITQLMRGKQVFLACSEPPTPNSTQKRFDKYSDMNAQAPSKKQSRTEEKTNQVATFGAGCFWHVEETFRTQPGVQRTSVGYMGGHFEHPCYLDVLSRITGHAEVAQIHYDPELISYEQLLVIFWQCHNPTTLNRQGPDRGEQYRSVVFYHTSEQAIAAQASKARLGASNDYPNPVVTEIKPAKDYWLATEDHQQYLLKKQKQTLQRLKASQLPIKP